MARSSTEIFPPGDEELYIIVRTDDDELYIKAQKDDEELFIEV